jgi:hypothetical protein
MIDFVSASHCLMVVSTLPVTICGWVKVKMGKPPTFFLCAVSALQSSPYAVDSQIETVLDQTGKYLLACQLSLPETYRSACPKCAMMRWASAAGIHVELCDVYCRLWCICSSWRLTASGYRPRLYASTNTKRCSRCCELLHA